MTGIGLWYIERNRNAVRAADLRAAITKQLLVVASREEYQLCASAPMPMFRARKRKNSQQHAQRLETHDGSEAKGILHRGIRDIIQ
jgi:hypothetical protein